MKFLEILWLTLWGFTALVVSGFKFPLSDMEHKIAAGYYTESGKYLGGIPKRKQETETYICNSFGYDNVAAIECINWTMNESDGDESEHGECTCGDYSLGYCSAWSCIGEEISEDENCKTVNGKKKCETEYHYEIEVTTCSCETVSENGKYCQKWGCEEVDGSGHVENEIYSCESESENGNFCFAWTGLIESSDEFEQSTCECTTEVEDQCYSWRCLERDYKKCRKGGSSWCNLGVSIGVGGLFGGIGFIVTSFLLFFYIAYDTVMGTDVLFSFIFSVIWACLWSIGVVIWGGSDGAFWVAMMWGTILGISLFFGIAVQIFDHGIDFVKDWKSKTKQDIRATEEEINVDTVTHTVTEEDMGKRFQMF